MIFGLAGLGSLSPGAGSLGTVVVPQSKEDFLRFIKSSYERARAEGYCAFDAAMLAAQKEEGKYGSNPPSALEDALEEFIQSRAAELQSNECGPVKTLTGHVPPDETVTTPGWFTPGNLNMIAPPTTFRRIAIPGTTAPAPPVQPVPADPPKDTSAIPTPEAKVGGVPWTMVLGFGAVAAVIGLMAWRSRDEYAPNGRRRRGRRSRRSDPHQYIGYRR